MRLERFGVLDEIAEKNKIMLDFDYPSGISTARLLSRKGSKMGRRNLDVLRLREAVRTARRYASPSAASRARVRGPDFKRLCSSLRILGLTPISTCYRRTRKGWHVILRLRFFRTLSPAEIVAVQVCLGSDIRRETLNLMRVLTLKKSSKWNLLFREKII